MERGRGGKKQGSEGGKGERDGMERVITSLNVHLFLLPHLMYTYVWASSLEF